jgi:HSP20 family protein
VQIEQDRLSVEARISLEPYSNMKPLYTEYGVGHFARSFRLTNAIDREGISASIADGVLTLTLPKVKEAASRKIEIR